jgi:hypothetical protein
MEEHKLKPKNFAAYWFNRDGAIRALKVAGITLAVMMVFLLAIFAYFRKDLPRISLIWMPVHKVLRPYITTTPAKHFSGQVLAMLNATLLSSKTLITIFRKQLLL